VRYRVQSGEDPCIMPSSIFKDKKGNYTDFFSHDKDKPGDILIVCREHYPTIEKAIESGAKVYNFTKSKYVD
jgi:hypothetical protein